jgi:hypothetical protein
VIRLIAGSVIVEFSIINEAVDPLITLQDKGKLKAIANVEVVSLALNGTEIEARPSWADGLMSDEAVAATTVVFAVAAGGAVAAAVGVSVAASVGAAGAAGAAAGAGGAAAGGAAGAGSAGGSAGAGGGGGGGGGGAGGAAGHHGFALTHFLRFYIQSWHDASSGYGMHFAEIIQDASDRYDIDGDGLSDDLATLVPNGTN